MFKIGILLLIFLFVSCAQRGKVHVDLNKGYNEVIIKPDRIFTTTSCLLEIKGNTDCNIKIAIPSNNSMLIDAGKVNVVKKMEITDNGNILKIYSQDCSNGAYLDINYALSSAYWGY